MMVEVNPYGDHPDRSGQEPKANIKPLFSYQNDNAPDQVEEKEGRKDREHSCSPDERFSCRTYQTMLLRYSPAKRSAKYINDSSESIQYE